MVFNFIDPADEEFKETMKKHEESLKFRCLRPCLAGSGEEGAGKPVALLMLARRNTHASLKPTNLQENVRKELYTKIMKTNHIAGKGINSLSHYNLVHKFVPMPKAMKIPDATAAVDEEWENLKRYRHRS